MGRSLATLRPILRALAVSQQVIIGPEPRLAAAAKRDRKGELTGRHEAMRTFSIVPASVPSFYSRRLLASGRRVLGSAQPIACHGPQGRPGRGGREPDNRERGCDVRSHV